VRLGSSPALEERADVPDADEFARHLARLGVPTEGAVDRPPIGPDERRAAAGVLRAAAERGYAVARRAGSEMEKAVR
jgi:hypothetical protein